MTTNVTVADEAPAEPTEPPDHLRAVVERAESLTKVGGVITAVLSAATASLLGGIVFAIRLGEASLPVEEALRVIPRDTLLLVGVRELLLAGVVTAALLLLTKNRTAMVVALIALTFAAPLTAAGLAWPAAIIAVAVVVAQTKRVEVAVGLAFLIACVVTSLRFTDPPYAFPVAHVVRTSDDSNECGRVEDDNQLCGAYLGKTDDGVYLGYPDRNLIIFVPKDGLRGIVLDPPPAGRAPSTSLLGRVTNLVAEPVSLTPLDWWVGGEHRAWGLFR